MDQVTEKSPQPIERAESFTNDEFHGFLLGRDIPVEALPKKIELDIYTPIMDEMYEHKEHRTYWEDTSIPLERKLKEGEKMIPIAGERGCSSFIDPETMTIQFTPIIHGKEGEVGREAYNLIDQKKLPLVEIHTHPENQFFSPEDLLMLVVQYGNARFMKAALLLCPDNQILAVATSETLKYSQDELSEKLEEWHQQYETDLDQISLRSLAKESLNTQRLTRAIARMRKLVESGKYTKDRLLKSSNRILERSNNYTFKESAQTSRAIFQKQNQALIGFAQMMGIQLYYSTDRKTFTAFSA